MPSARKNQLRRQRAPHTSAPAPLTFTWRLHMQHLQRRRLWKMKAKNVDT
jgi:hypothetical protein